MLAKDTIARVESAPQLQYVSNLRGVITVFVVLVHAVLAYSQTLPWWVRDAETSLFYDAVFAVLDLSMIPVLFYLAGMFVPRSLRRRGSAGFTVNKFMRLGGPLVLLTVFYCPWTFFLSITSSGAPAPPVAEFWALMFRNLWDSRLHLLCIGDDLSAIYVFMPIHLWFLAVLFLFMAIAALVWRFAPFAPRKAPPESVRQFLRVLFGLAGGAVVAMTLIGLHMSDACFFQMYGLLQLQPFRIPLYVACFVLGIYAGITHFEMHRVGAARFWAGLYTLSVIVVLAGSFRWFMSGASMSLVPALVYALARVGAAFSIIVLSCRFAHKRLASRQTILGKLGDHSYAIYCLHLPIVVGVQYLLLPVSMPILLKCTLSLVLPVVVSFVLAAKLVRPHPRWAVVLLLSFFLGAAIVF